MKTGSTLKRKTGFKLKPRAPLVKKVYINRGKGFKLMTKKDGEVVGGYVNLYPKPRAMKRGRLRKASKQPISKLQRVLWELCKQIIRARHGNTCYTCGRTGLIGSNWHTGHMWAKASLGAYLKYDLRVLRPQCAVCNLFYGGRGAEFYRKMLKENGEAFMEQLEKDKNVEVRAYDHYLYLIEVYKKINEER